MEKNRENIYLNPEFPFHISRRIITSINLSYMKSGYQLIYIRDGELFNENPLQDKEYKANSLVIIPPGADVVFAIKQKPELFHLLFGQGFVSRIMSIIRNNKIMECFYLNSSTNKQILNLPLIAEVSENTFKLLNVLFKEFTEKEESYESLLYIKFAEILVSIYREQIGGRMKIISKTNIRNINDVINYIKQNYTTNFSLKEMALKCGLNFSYFSRAFKEKAGMPLFEYINSRRVEKACMLLKKTDMSIIEIAYTVGYNNISFFNRYFRKIMHTTPSEYRKGR
jgi:AraC-like DNA-binding protein